MDTALASQDQQTHKDERKKQYRILLIGPPGSGKGTQAEKLVNKLGLTHLSSGDILRETVAKGDDLATRLKAIMDAGQLVPDDLMVDLISVRIVAACQGPGFILDGFPRTVNQARMLDDILGQQGVSIQVVIELCIDDDILVKRITGRLIHPGSGRSYHVEFRPPKVSMTDDVTGEPLIKRSDDNEETLRKRLVTYHSQTAPVSAYYEERGVLRKLDAGKGSNENWQEIEEILDGLG